MVPVELNGKATEFLFDPGAAITIISQKYVDYFKIVVDTTRRTKLFVAHDKPVYAPRGHHWRNSGGQYCKKKFAGQYH